MFLRFAFVSREKFLLPFLVLIFEVGITPVLSVPFLLIWSLTGDEYKSFTHFKDKNSDKWKKNESKSKGKENMKDEKERMRMQKKGLNGWDEKRRRHSNQRNYDKPKQRFLKIYTWKERVVFCLFSQIFVSLEVFDLFLSKV